MDPHRYLQFQLFHAIHHSRVDYRHKLLTVFGHKFEPSVAGLIGAASVVVVGKWLAGRKPPGAEKT